MLGEIGCWYVDWSAIGTWVGAIAAFWAWRTAKASHELGKGLAERATADAFELELERVALQATVVHVEATRLRSLAENTRLRATSKAHESGSYGSSRMKLFVIQLAGYIGDAAQAIEDLEHYRKGMNRRFEGSTDQARQARIRLTELATEVRGKAERLEIEGEGWT